MKPNMKIAQNTVVSLTYELEVNGEIVDRATQERPLEFIQGTGSLLPLFEKNIEGKEAGEGYEFTLEPADGYGEWKMENIIDLPIGAFEVDGKLQTEYMEVGKIVPLMNSMGGVIPAKVLEVGKESVKMDLNHPMAGKTLHFTGTIVKVREASEKELAEGLHGELAGGGCSGHCGGCKGECSEEEGESCHGGDHKGGCCGKGEGHHKEGGCCGKGEGHHKEGGCCGKGEGHHKEGGCCGKGQKND